MSLFLNLRKIRAAHALTIAMADGRQPDAKILKALGLDEKLAKRFIR